MMVHIIHRPEDGYLLSYDKEVIKEQLSLKDFISRIRNAEGAQRESLEQEMDRINFALRNRKEREIVDWLDHRYANLIRLGKLKLMQHNYSVNAQKVEVYTESVGNSERNIKQSTHWSNGVKQYPMTTDEAYQKSVTDDEVYYSMTP